MASEQQMEESLDKLTIKMGQLNTYLVGSIRPLVEDINRLMISVGMDKILEVKDNINGVVTLQSLALAVIDAARHRHQVNQRLIEIKKEYQDVHLSLNAGKEKYVDAFENSWGKLREIQQNLVDATKALDVTVLAYDT